VFDLGSRKASCAGVIGSSEVGVPERARDSRGRFSFNGSFAPSAGASPALAGANGAVGAGPMEASFRGLSITGGDRMNAFAVTDFAIDGLSAFADLMEVFDASSNTTHVGLISPATTARRQAGEASHAMTSRTCRPTIAAPTRRRCKDGWGRPNEGCGNGMALADTRKAGTRIFVGILHHLQAPSA